MQINCGTGIIEGISISRNDAEDDWFLSLSFKALNDLGVAPTMIPVSTEFSLTVEQKAQIKNWLAPFISAAKTELGLTDIINYPD